MNMRKWAVAMAALMPLAGTAAAQQKITLTVAAGQPPAALLSLRLISTMFIPAVTKRLAEEKFKRPILEQYARESSPYYATARLWDDGILDPVKTRAALALAFAATSNAPLPAAAYGTFRM